MTVNPTVIPRVGGEGAFAVEPPRDRPDSPPASYGVPREGGTFIDWETVVRRLETSSAYWLATVTRDGRPHVVPVWGVMVGADLYLETGAPETIKNRNIGRNDAVVVHLDNVDDVVIVIGRAAPERPDPSLGRLLADAYHLKYGDYQPEPDSWSAGGLVRIDPERVLAWREMPTATRWRFARWSGR